MDRSIKRSQKSLFCTELCTCIPVVGLIKYSAVTRRTGTPSVHQPSPCPRLKNSIGIYYHDLIRRFAQESLNSQIFFSLNKRAIFSGQVLHTLQNFSRRLNIIELKRS